MILFRIENKHDMQQVKRWKKKIKQNFNKNKIDIECGSFEWKDDEGLLFSFQST